MATVRVHADRRRRGGGVAGAAAVAAFSIALAGAVVATVVDDADLPWSVWVLDPQPAVGRSAVVAAQPGGPALAGTWRGGPGFVRIARGRSVASLIPSVVLPPDADPWLGDYDALDDERRDDAGRRWVRHVASATFGLPDGGAAPSEVAGRWFFVLGDGSSAVVALEPDGTTSGAWSGSWSVREGVLALRALDPGAEFARDAHIEFSGVLDEVRAAADGPGATARKLGAGPSRPADR